MPASEEDKRTRKKGKPGAHLVSDNADSYGWTNLTLAVQLLLPIALIALILGRKKFWIYPYPLLDNYISALCPSFSQQQRLLKWMSTRIPHMNNLPNKVTQYWQNGSLLCTLINTVVPGACPNPQKHWKTPPTHGQALAYKYLGVAPVLTEQDYKNPIPSSSTERKFIKYLLSLQEAINRTSIEEDTLRFTSKYVARGMGLVIGEQNKPSYFYIYPNIGTNKMENILVNIKGPYNTFGNEVICPNSKKNENIKELVKFSKDINKEQDRLAYKSDAQRSFFRSVSFDIAPIMNLMTNKKNTGEIMVKIEMEEGRAKIIFLPKFSGIYELLLTNDGQHLQGSPFVVRITKTTKGIDCILQGNTKIFKRKIERKTIGRSLDFGNESVSITDEFYMKLDTNNNTNAIDNKSDDESVYQDSGIFDLSDTIKKSDFDDEVSDATKNTERDLKSMGDSPISDIPKEENDKIIPLEEIQNNVKFLIENFDNKPDLIEDHLGHQIKTESKDIFNEIELQNSQDFENLYNKYAEDEEIVPNKENDENLEYVPKNIKKTNPEISTKFIEISEDVSSGTDFEILSNIPEFQKGRKITSIDRIVEIFERDAVNQIQSDVISTTTKSDLDVAKSKDSIANSDFIIIKTDVVTTSSLVKSKSNLVPIKSNLVTPKSNQVTPKSVQDIRKSDLPTPKSDIIATKSNLAPTNMNLIKPKSAPPTLKTLPLKSTNIAHNASPVFTQNIAQEAATQIEDIPQLDSPNLEIRYAETSKKEKRTKPSITRDFSVYIDNEDIYDTNVKEIKNIFERKPENKDVNRRFVAHFKKDQNLKESAKKFAKSLPNLLAEDNLNVENGDVEDEFVLKFNEKRNFWNNLITENSNSSLNMSSTDVSSPNIKLLSRQYENVSQSTNSLNGPYKAIGNKFHRRKEELYKTNSLDLNREDCNMKDKIRKVARAESLYDRIRIFDKDFDSDKHTTLLKRTKERTDISKIRKSEILKPDSLTNVPNTTSTNQIEEDLQFAEIMKERFENSRRYFSSLETVSIKPNLTRRHSMDCSARPPLNEKLLQRGGSLKMLNVFDRFSLDNLYRDVVLNKIKNCNFKGGPNKEALVETLSSVSSCENLDQSKDIVEEDDLNMQFFNIRKRLRKRRSIKSIFDINY